MGLTEEAADTLARAVAIPDILEYADVAHQAILAWLRSLPDEALDEQPDVPARLARYPVYLRAHGVAEVPWMYQQPAVWRCLAPGLGHARDHLAEIDLLKRQTRARKG